MGTIPRRRGLAARSRAVWLNGGVTSDYLNANQAHWDDSVAPHLVSYDADGFVADPERLSDVVRRDADLLRPHLPGGRIAGLRLAHLQCHIGTDSLSWARLRADVVGLDFSPEAVAAATDLARRAGLDDRARFVCGAVDDAPEALGRGCYDVVYTSIGVLAWLPRLDTWAQAIRELLRPGGVFFIREDHPMAFTLDDSDWSAGLRVTMPYFRTDEPLTWDEAADYMGAVLEHSRTYEWPHPLSETLGSLLAAGLVIEAFDEYPAMEWRLAPGLVLGAHPDYPDMWALPDHPERVPLTFSVVARAPSDSDVPA